MDASANLTRPVVVFDGQCGFCRFWIERWRQRTGDRVEFVPYQDDSVAARFAATPRAAFARAVHMFEPGGRVSTGAAAVFRLHAWATGETSPRLPEHAGLWTSLYDNVPGFAASSELTYRVVASNRPFFTRITRLFWGRVPDAPTYAIGAWLFRRALGFNYLFAFGSLSVQVLGLIGEHGILPAGVSNSSLMLMCRTGVALSVLLIVGVAPAAVTALLWAGYLLFSTLAGNFLSYQWDALLLETGLLAIFIAPMIWRDRLAAAADPPRLGVRLMMWLLFRLMVGSGAIKLSSGDPTWRDLSALSYHFYTQPIPTPAAWYFNRLPLGMTKALTLGVFIVELGAPLLILLPRRPKILAAILIAALQFVIALTGNYAFFNWLTIALCLLLIDDAALRRVARTAPVTLRPQMRGALRRALIVVVAVVTIPVSAVAFARTFGRAQEPWPIASDVAAIIAPLRSVNTYGLFASMTIERPEIIIEGTDDGVTWKAYEFRYKPGDLTRRPPWVAPHQPRLDWEMWFAALSPYYADVWFNHFRARLLEASPDVLHLLAHDPFDGRPPIAIRAEAFAYHFTTAAERAATGAWWTRQRLGLYTPDLAR